MAIVSEKCVQVPLLKLSDLFGEKFSVLIAHLVGGAIESQNGDRVVESEASLLVGVGLKVGVEGGEEFGTEGFLGHLDFVAGDLAEFFEPFEKAIWFCVGAEGDGVLEEEEGDSGEGDIFFCFHWFYPFLREIWSSLSCWSETSLGHPVMGQAAVAVLGKAMTSRMLSNPPRSIRIRSNPRAMPPWGGVPYWRAFRKNPKRFWISSWGSWRSWKIFSWICGLWIRMLPLPSSTPLRTRS